MTFRRKICWSAAMRDLRRDRAPRSVVSPMTERSLAVARLVDAVEQARRRPLRTPSAGYDRAAIMTYALALARRARAQGSSLPWRSLAAAALRTVWSRARVQAPANPTPSRQQGCEV